MPVMDDIREQAKNAKDKGFKYALSYFWEYYKFWVIGIIVGIVIVVSLIKTIVSYKPIGFEVIFADSYLQLMDGETVGDYLGVDMDEYSVMLDYSYQFSTEGVYNAQTLAASSQKLAAVVGSKELDIFVCKQDVYDKYKNYILGDLTEFFGKDFLDSLGDKVIYGTIEDSDGNVSGPFPLAIDISDAPQIVNNGIYKQEDTVYFCIVPNNSHPDYCVKFFDFLYTE